MPQDFGLSTPLDTNRPQLHAGTLFFQYTVTLKDGLGALQRGTVLARVTATDEYVPLAPAGTGGAQTALAILADDVTVGAQAAQSKAYGFGEFIEQGLIFPPLTDAQRATMLHNLRMAGIFITTAY